MKKWIYSLQFNFPSSETLSHLSSSSDFWAKFPIIKEIINEDEIMHNNWLDHLVFLCALSLLLGKIQEKSDLVHYRFHSISIDTGLDSG